MATAACWLVLQLLSLGPWGILASTSVASTAFVLFASPKSAAARPWNVLMGHVVGLAAGLMVLPLMALASVPAALPYALSVGVSVLLMQLLRAQHPPAAGTALTVPAAVPHGGFTAAMAAVILLTVVGLLLVQWPLRGRLPDGE